MCWGNAPYHGNSYETIGDTEVPADVGPLELGGAVVVRVEAGVLGGCVILSDESLRCWGKGNQGEVGLGRRRRLPWE